jgi:hypothetical protein
MADHPRQATASLDSQGAAAFESSKWKEQGKAIVFVSPHGRILADKLASYAMQDGGKGISKTSNNRS